MILMDKNSENKNVKSEINNKLDKPNENSGVSINTHIKISDPNTGYVFVQKRGDI